MNVGLPELVIILVVVLLVFGKDRIPEIGRALGEGLKQFRGAEEASDVGGKKIPEAPAPPENMIIEEPAQNYRDHMPDRLQVFVSSDIDEFKQEREALHNLFDSHPILSRISRPFIFEFSAPASPDNPAEVYKEKIRRTDVFITLLGIDLPPAVSEEHTMAINFGIHNRLYFLKKIERTQLAQRFIDSISATWIEFDSPRALGAQVETAIVTLLIESVRKSNNPFGLTLSDVALLIPFAIRLNLSEEIVDELKQLHQDTTDARHQALREIRRDKDAMDMHHEASGSAKTEEYPATVQELGEINHESANSLNNRAEKLLSSGKYMEALLALNTLLELEPDNAVALATRGEALRLLGHYGEALRDLNRSVELRPDNAWALRERGEILSVMGRNREALRDLNKSLELEPDNARAIRHRGGALRGLGRHREALRDLNKSLELEPDNAWALHERGALYVSLRDYKRAERDFGASLKLEPHNAFTNDQWRRLQALKNRKR